MTRGTWAARVEDEEFVYDGATREEAIAHALEAFCADIDAGWREAGDYTVHVWSSVVWHERCGNDECGHCAPLEWRHGAVIVSDVAEPSIRVTVYHPDDEETPWRLADD